MIIIKYHFIFYIKCRFYIAFHESRSGDNFYNFPGRERFPGFLLCVSFIFYHMFFFPYQKWFGVRSRACEIISFFFYGRVIFHCRYIPHLLYPFIYYGHLGCFHVLVIVNSASMNISSNVDGPRYYHTKWSKPDRGRQISYDIAYMWNLKKMIQMGLFTKQK